MASAQESGTASERLAAQVEQIIISRINNDKLALPAFPAVAAKCLQVLKNPDFSNKSVVALLEQDPVLSARVLRLANSVAYKASAAGQLSLSAAVVRLGAQKVRSLLVEATVQQLYESRDKRIAASLSSIWEHSVAVAILARDLAALTNQTAVSETVYLCGLLHDVGKMIVASILLEAEKMIFATRPNHQWVGSDEWLAAVNRSHRSVGVTLAERWTLPQEVLAAVKECADYDSVNRNAASNYVRFANAVAKREGIYIGNVDGAEIETLIMIGRSLLDVDDELLNRVTSKLGERVKAQMA